MIRYVLLFAFVGFYTAAAVETGRALEAWQTPRLEDETSSGLRVISWHIPSRMQPLSLSSFFKFAQDQATAQGFSCDVVCTDDLTDARRFPSKLERK